MKAFISELTRYSIVYGFNACSNSLDPDQQAHSSHLICSGPIAGRFLPFWEYDPYFWNWEISHHFARNWESFSIIGE
jgi:hypothetical protein